MDPRILYSLQAAVLFFIIASPFMYSLTRKLLKMDAYGSLALHAGVYGVLVYLLMIVQK